jgi:hypothetical protein
MSQIKRQRRAFLLAVRTNPSLATPSGWHGPAHPAPTPLAVEEGAALAVRPRSLAHRLVQLWRWADLRSPHLVGPGQRAGFLRLARLPWLRPLDGLGPVAEVRVVVEHLVCRYPIPPAFLALFDTQVCGREDPALMRLAEVAACLGRGAGFREVDRLLHGQLTRRVFAQLVASKMPTAILALRDAQVRAAGGPAWLAAALVQHRAFAALDRTPLALVAWLCREAEPGELGHVLDYLSAVPLDLPGRTWASVTRLAAEWRLPRPSVPVDTRPFPPSGIGDGLPEAFADWRLRELHTGLELAVDGNVMHHCVATYCAHARAGVVSLWSARRGDHRVLTIEVRNAERAIVQVRGKYNRRPDAEEVAMLAGWAEVNGLVLRAAALR